LDSKVNELGESLIRIINCISQYNSRQVTVKFLPFSKETRKKNCKLQTAETKHLR